MILAMAISHEELLAIKQYVKKHQGMNEILADRIFAELESHRKIELESLAKKVLMLLSSLVSNIRRRKHY